MTTVLAKWSRDELAAFLQAWCRTLDRPPKRGQIPAKQYMHEMFVALCGGHVERARMPVRFKRDTLKNTVEWISYHHAQNPHKRVASGKKKTKSRSDRTVVEHKLKEFSMSASERKALAQNASKGLDDQSSHSFLPIEASSRIARADVLTPDRDLLAPAGAVVVTASCDGSSTESDSELGQWDEANGSGASEQKLFDHGTGKRNIRSKEEAQPITRPLPIPLSNVVDPSDDAISILSPRNESGILDKKMCKSDNCNEKVRVAGAAGYRASRATARAQCERVVRQSVQTKPGRLEKVSASLCRSVKRRRSMSFSQALFLPDSFQVSTFSSYVADQQLYSGFSLPSHRHSHKSSEMSGKSARKRTDAWSGAEVTALVLAWRDALEHPDAWRHSTQSAYIYQQFLALQRIDDEANGDEDDDDDDETSKSQRTEVSVMFKRKVWRYVAQFICAFGKSAWFKMSVSERAAWFNEHRTATYNFVDLDPDIVDTISSLIELEENMLRQGDKGAPRRRRRYAKGRKDSGGSEASVVLPANHGATGRDSVKPTHPIFDPSFLQHARGGGNDFVIDGDDGHDDDSSDSSSSSENEFEDRMRAARSFSRNWTTLNRKEALPPALMELIETVQKRTRDVGALMDLAKQERQEAHERRLEYQQHQKRDEDRLKDLVDQLKREQEVRLEDQRARQDEQKEWTQILIQIQRNQKAWAAEQEEREKEREERNQLMSMLKLERKERELARDAWKTEQEEIAKLVEELRAELIEREQEKTELELYAQQIQIERDDGKQTLALVRNNQSPLRTRSPDLESNDAMNKGSIMQATLADGVYRCPFDGCDATYAEKKFSSLWQHCRRSHGVMVRKHRGPIATEERPLKQRK
ncbi:hypothetical protein FI667_g16468, partial [Globisporangium splendens]